MTKEELLETIFAEEDLTALLDRLNVSIGTSCYMQKLTNIAKAIADIDIIEQLNVTYVSDFDDVQLQRFRKIIRKLLLEIDIELYKRHTS